MIDDSRPIALTGGHPDDLALLYQISQRENLVLITPDLHRGVEVSIDEFNPVDAEVVDIEYSTPQRVLLVGSSNSSTLRAAMVAALLGAGLTRTVDAFTEAIPSFANDWRWDFSVPPEWRWSNLHHKLSLQATLLKEKKVQQRRQALFNHYQEKRAKKGRSHAKQRAKSMKQFA